MENGFYLLYKTSNMTDKVCVFFSSMLFTAWMGFHFIDFSVEKRIVFVIQTLKPLGHPLLIIFWYIENSVCGQQGLLYRHIIQKTFRELCKVTESN